MFHALILVMALSQAQDVESVQSLSQSQDMKSLQAILVVCRQQVESYREQLKKATANLSIAREQALTERQNAAKLKERLVFMQVNYNKKITDIDRRTKTMHAIMCVGIGLAVASATASIIWYSVSR